MEGGQVQPVQVKPLSLGGSGSKTKVGQELIEHNNALTMLSAQANTNTVYDATVPSPQQPAVFVQGFSDYSVPITSASLAVCGILIFIYGIVVDK